MNWPGLRCALIFTCHWISSSRVSKAKSTTSSLQMIAMVLLSFSSVKPVSMARKPSNESEDLVLAFLQRSLLSRYICKCKQSVVWTTIVGVNWFMVSLVSHGIYWYHLMVYSLTISLTMTSMQLIYENGIKSVIANAKQETLNICQHLFN